jgi:hypothetical protein
MDPRKPKWDLQVRKHLAHSSEALSPTHHRPHLLCCASGQTVRLEGLSTSVKPRKPGADCLTLHGLGIFLKE